MKTRLHRFAPLAVSLVLFAGTQTAQATLVIPGGDRSACPDPTFNACYLGVDGSTAATLTANSSATFSFLGLGVQSGELPAVTFPTGGTGSSFPVGSLTLLSGSTFNVAGTVNPLRSYDVSTIVGLGNNSTGYLFVNGATLNTPILLIGEQDSRVSSGQVTVAYGGTVTASVDSSATGPVPGLAGISIGRGAGSTGSLYVDGIGSSVSTTGSSVSIGRAGAGVLQVTGGATFSTFGSLYGSTGDPAGTSSIFVSGAGTTLNIGAGGNLLVGIATTGSGINLTYDRTLTSHGTSTLDVTDGAVVHGNVVAGSGGTVRGSGFINGNLTSYGALMSPGNSPGTLHVNGNFLMDGGTYLVEIAGTGADMTDLIDVSGTATISNATILFSFIDGFAPSAGFTFDFLQAAQGLSFSNLTFATQGLLPNFTFTTGQSNGAFVFTATSNGQAVPEPETLPLLLVGLLGIVAAALRRKRATR
jgi:T5SS/PEP-CTERM-associated repeat protein